MAIQPFLAMTGAEMRNFPGCPQGICWMACHFSPYGLGLSNLPRALPTGSLLMVDDITPLHSHRGDIIAAQLEGAVKELGCAGVLLDLQRPGCGEAAALACALAEALPCPVAVSDVYARELGCPVFLSAPPCHVPLAKHFAPWQGREIWLELSESPEVITVTADGAQMQPLPHCEDTEAGFRDEALHCHYTIAVTETAAVFTLRRSREDLKDLLQEAEAFGVTTAVGLFQELHPAG